MSIVDKDKNVLQILQHSHFYKKYIHAHFLERPWYPPMVLKPNYEMGWRGGTILNKDWKPGTVYFDKNLPVMGNIISNLSLDLLINTSIK